MAKLNHTTKTIPDLIEYLTLKTSGCSLDMYSRGRSSAYFDVLIRLKQMMSDHEQSGGVGKIYICTQTSKL